MFTLLGRRALLILGLLLACAGTATFSQSTVGGPTRTGGPSTIGGGGTAAIAVVNSVANHLGSSGGTTSSANMTGANLCILGVSAFGPITSVSSSPANTWVLDKTTNDAGAFFTYLYRVYAPSVNSAMTFTVSAAGSTFVSAAAVCFNSTIGSTLDQSNSAFTNSAASLQPGSITPGHASEVVIAVTDTGNGTSLSMSGGYTAFGSIAGDGATYEGIQAGYLIQTTATATNPTTSWTTAGPASAVIGSYQ